jgi:hypothetical protein
MDKRIYIFNKTTRLCVVDEEDSGFLIVEIVGDNKTTLTARIKSDDVQDGIDQGTIEIVDSDTD